MRSLVIVLMLVLSAGKAACDVSYLWAKNLTGSGRAYISALDLDAAGDVYVAGKFSGAIDFDSGHSYDSIGDSIFIAKYGANGGLEWVRQIGPSGNELLLSDMVVDNTGKIVISGRFTYEVDFDPGPGVVPITAATGSKNIFILKLSGGGDFEWVRAIEGDQDIYVSNQCVDTANNVLLAGTFGDTVDFNPESANHLTTSVNGLDAFILRLDSQGAFMNLYHIGGEGDVVTVQLSQDTAGNILLGGAYNGSTDFDPGAGEYWANPVSGHASFVLKLTTNGEFVWNKSLEGIAWSRLTSVVSDWAGRVYIGGARENENLSLITQFLLRVNGAGDTDWEWTQTSPVNQAPLSVQVDSAGHAYMVKDVADVNGPGVSESRLQFAKLNDAGQLLWEFALQAERKSAAGVKLDSAGNLYIAGGYRGFLDTNPSAMFDPIFAGDGDYAAFVLKFSSAPRLLSLSPQSIGPVNTEEVVVQFEFDEDVQGFDNEQDVEIVHNGTAHASVSVSGGPRIYSVKIAGITGSGTFSFAATHGSDVRDLDGNALEESALLGTATIDRSLPALPVNALSVFSILGVASLCYTICMNRRPLAKMPRRA